MKPNTIVLVSLINSLILVGNMSEPLAQEEDVLWEETEVIPDDESLLETEAELTEEITELTEEITDYSSESELTEEITVNETVVSNGNEVEPVVLVEAKPNETPTTESQQSTGEISPELASNETSTPTTQESSSNQVNPLPLKESSPLENLANENGEILPSVTYDPPVIPDHSGVVEELLPVVQPITENVATPSEELAPSAAIPAMDEECHNPAIYFNDIREAHLPAVEVPLYLDITGQPISSIGLFAVKLKIPFGFADFELKEAVFKEILINSDPCNAKFIPETGILSIPQVEIPTLIAAIDSTPPPAVGPVIKCSAVLQQSNIRISVLSLKDLQCTSPG